MNNTWYDLKACEHCRRPAIEKRGRLLYCPTCDTTYREHDTFSNDLKVISGPSFDILEENVNLLMEKGSPYRNKSGQWQLTKLLDKFGIDSRVSTERWLLAVSHLEYLYHVYRIIRESPNIPRMLLLSQRPPLRSKLSASGYFFNCFRPGISPFTFLSDDGFMIIMNCPPYYPKTNCRFIPKSKAYNLYYYLNEDYREANWRKGTDELLVAGLIEEAPFEVTLQLLTVKRINEELKECEIKRGKNKTETIAAAVGGLPENVLQDLITPVQGYIPTSLAMKEFRLRDYSIRCLQDEVRHHNMTSMDKKTHEEYPKRAYLHGTPELIECFVSMLEAARNAYNYDAYLSSGQIPVEAFLSEAHVKLNAFDTAYKEVKRAYKLDIKHNDILHLSNISHFCSLIGHQRRLEILLSEVMDPPRPELANNLKVTEKMLTKWTTLHKRGREDGFTDFLLINHESIFETFGDCSRDSENKYRDMIGVPRIAEGWVREAELLHIIRDIFRREKVIHQASPEWLGLQRLDIYIPRHKIAIEHQGIQHYESVPFFGGEEGFLRTQKLDERKARLCSENEVSLVYFRYDEPIVREIVEARIKAVAQGQN